MKEAFDNEKYLNIQRDRIMERISSFDGKLYLEFGGKLYDDDHASRVLPGFKPNSKLDMLVGLKDKVEIVIAVNSDDIISNKIRGNKGITYEAESFRLIDVFREYGFLVSSVVLSFYKDTPQTKAFITKLKHNNIKVYKHYKINGYPKDIELTFSDDGLGKNEYIQTTKELVVVTAPGPGSGKMATCMSQLYHDYKNGIKSGYAKYETFPVWNLPINHPVNLAYEAATVDLSDVNMIDPYHLEAYGEVAVNYNRDVDTFPLLKAMFEKIYGKSPYNSPTDMGVNMIGFAIKDDEVAIKNAKDEIIRRYYQAKKNFFFGKYQAEDVEKVEMLMNKLSITVDDRKCIKPCLDKEKKSLRPSMALELENGIIVTGKRGELLSSASALILNALKTLAGIDDKYFLLSPSVIEPIADLKINYLHNPHTIIHADEILIALSIQASTNQLAHLAYEKLPLLRGLEAHSSVILPESEMRVFEKLGIHVTEEPTTYANKIYFN